MGDKSNVYELIKARVSYGRFLYYQKADPEFSSEINLPNPIPIPFGSVRQTLGYKFFVRLGNLDRYELFAVAKNDAKGEIQILPEFRSVGKINTKKFGDIEVEIRELINDIDRRRAMQLIMRAHYLNPPLKGLFIGCWMTNPEQAKQVRAKESARKQGSWSDAWTEPINKAGHMVGCAVLDTLYQGLPNGRKTIIKQEKLTNILDSSDGWIEKKGEELRPTIVNLLGIAWASRFVVDEPYQGLQLGTLLAKKLVEVAYLHRVPRAKFIEVITTEATQKAKERLKHPETSFLGRAGYTLDQHEMSSRMMLVPDENGNRIKFESGRKLYYFIETSSYGNKKF